MDNKKVEDQDTSKPTYPNINVPVKKGHDLVEVQPDFSVKLVDGTGAHNSPRDAVRDDGSVEGNPDVDVAGMDEPAEKTQGDPGNVRSRDTETKDAKSNDSPKPSDKDVQNA